MFYLYHTSIINSHSCGTPQVYKAIQTHFITLINLFNTLEIYILQTPSNIEI